MVDKSDKPEQSVEQFGSLGVPTQEVADTGAVKKGHSRLAKREADEQQLAGDLDELRDDETDELFGIEKVLRWPALRYSILLVCGLALLFVFGQGLSLLERIQRMPRWGQYVSYAALGLLAIAIVWSMVRLFGSYLRLQRTPRIALSALYELSDRAAIRQEANVAVDEARRKRERYLRSYQIETGKQVKRLLKAGVKKEEIQKLRKVRADLLSGQAAGASSEGWLADFEGRFLGVLDKLVDRRINSYSLRVGLKTAIAPTGLLDTAVVMINAHMIVADLCTIYNLRATRIGTTAIVFRMFISILAASQMEEAAESVTEAMLSEAAAGFGINLAKQVLRRVGEGVGNALLFRRLGKATKRHLRPLQVK